MSLRRTVPIPADPSKQPAWVRTTDFENNRIVAVIVDQRNVARVARQLLGVLFAIVGALVAIYLRSRQRPKDEAARTTDGSS